MKLVSTSHLMKVEQDAKWRRSLVMQWCAQEGLIPENVRQLETLESGDVLVTEYVRDRLGRVVFDADHPCTERVITPKVPGPWAEWEEHGA